MIRFCKSIRNHFLLLAGFVIITHMIIPHDHHMSFPESGIKDNCPVSDKKTDHHPLIPSHCYAFNDLAAEKFTPVIIRQFDQIGFAAVIWYPDYIIPGEHLSQTVLPSSEKPFQETYVPDLFPFRAPPLFS